MQHETYSNDLIRSVLSGAKRIAMIGASDNPARPSYFVFKYLAERGYDVIPVNPARVGKDLLGVPFAASLAEIEGSVDMINIFRNSEAVPAIIDEVLRVDPLPRYIWMQLGVRHDESAARAEAAGLTVIMNRCPKIEYGRLSGEISWQGVNSRVISAKRPVRSQTGVQKLLLKRED